MNTLLRILILLLLGSCFAAAQQSACSTVEIVASRPSSTVMTPRWRISVHNKGGKSLVVRMSPLEFRWKIEEASEQGWEEVLTGGVGPGKASIGASPSQGMDTRTIAKHHGSLVIDFDLRRNAPIDDTIKPGRRYRITFAQAVTLFGRGQETVCKLVAEPQLFTVKGTLNGR